MPSPHGSELSLVCAREWSQHTGTVQAVLVLRLHRTTSQQRVIETVEYGTTDIL